MILVREPLQVTKRAKAQRHRPGEPGHQIATDGMNLLQDVSVCTVVPTHTRVSNQPRLSKNR